MPLQTTCCGQSVADDDAAAAADAIISRLRDIGYESGDEGAEFSDRRLKKDLRVIRNALQKVSMLHGYTYSRLCDGGKGRRSVGVVAQEVSEVLPEAVYRDAPSGMQKVAYGNLVALLIEAVKELASFPRGFQEEGRKLLLKESCGDNQIEMLPRSIPAEVFVNGEVAGIDANGYLTKEFARAVSFAIIREKCRRRRGRRPQRRCRSDDSYCSDSASLCHESDGSPRRHDDDHHHNRDPISISGRAPVKLPDGIVPARGDYIIAVLAADSRGISGHPCAPADMTFAKRANAVGRVMTFLPDGRPSLRILF